MFVCRLFLSHCRVSFFFSVSLSVSSPPKFPFASKSTFYLYVPFSPVSIFILFLFQYIFIISLYFRSSLVSAAFSCLYPFFCLYVFSCLVIIFFYPVTLSVISMLLYRFLLFLLSSFSVILFFFLYLCLYSSCFSSCLCYL